MKFLIKPNCEEAKSFYQNHSTYHDGDSGLDLFIVEDLVIPAGETKIVDLGISCQLKGCDTKVDKYYSYNMYSRSSISKTPLRLANGVGLCDAGYLGPLKAALHNTSLVDFTIKKGERYVQLARPDLGEISFELVEEFGRSTTRGEGGFGSTLVLI
jgi:dUTP pyrophosphatase